jgi:hypothetical protein
MEHWNTVRSVFWFEQDPIVPADLNSILVWSFDIAGYRESAIFRSLRMPKGK